MVGTHSLGFLMAPVAPEVPGALGSLGVQVCQYSHQPPGGLEGPGCHMDDTVIRST